MRHGAADRAGKRKSRVQPDSAELRRRGRGRRLLDDGVDFGGSRCRRSVTHCESVWEKKRGGNKGEILEVSPKECMVKRGEVRRTRCRFPLGSAYDGVVNLFFFSLFLGWPLCTEGKYWWFGNIRVTLVAL